MISILIFLTEACLYLEARARVRLPSVLDITLPYIFLMQLVFYLSQFYDIVDDDTAGNLATYKTDNLSGLLIYFCIFLLTWIASLRLEVKTLSSGRRGRAVFDIFGRYAAILATIVFVYTTLIITLINKDILWLNYEYTLLASPRALSDAPLASLLASLAQLVGVISGLGLSLSILTRRWVLLAVFGVSLSWQVALGLGGSSRTAALNMLIPAVMIFSLTKGRDRLFAVPFATLGLLFIVMALSGRDHGQFGLSTIFPTFYTSLDELGSLTARLLVNVTQGIFVTSDGMLLNADFSSNYKLLSFSPFPSAIDNFDAIRDTGQVRLHYFVPMSAITEVIEFGPPYMLLFGLTYVFLIRTCLIVLKRGSMILSALASGWTLLVFVQANAYPVRNVFRQELLLALVLLAFTYGVSAFKHRSNRAVRV